MHGPCGTNFGGYDAGCTSSASDLESAPHASVVPCEDACFYDDCGGRSSIVDVSVHGDTNDKDRVGDICADCDNIGPRDFDFVWYHAKSRVVRALFFFLSLCCKVEPSATTGNSSGPY